MWRRVLVVWSASRLAVLSLGLLLTTQLGWHRALEPWQTKFFRSITGWDSVYYLKISHTGYHPGKDVAFFPLYPATIWGAREVVRVGDAVAAVAISNLALLVGLFGMYILARDRLSEDHARRGILYLVLSPYAFALAMAYSEGLFLALATWLFVLSDRRRDMAARAARVRRGPHPGHRPGPRRTARTAGVAAPHLRVGRARRRSAGRVRGPRRVARPRRWRSARDGARPAPLGRAPVDPAGEPRRPVPRLRAHARRLLPHRRRHVHRLSGAAHPHPAAGHLRADAMGGRALRRRHLRDAAPLRRAAVVGRFGLVAFPLAFAMADLGLRSERVHRAYVVYAPTAQIILFAAAALGYRPP